MDAFWLKGRGRTDSFGRIDEIERCAEETGQGVG